jgi:hypothetical protein
MPQGPASSGLGLAGHIEIQAFQGRIKPGKGLLCPQKEVAVAPLLYQLAHW